MIVLLTAFLTAGFALAQQATIIGKLEGHTSPVYSVAWSPDGKSLATAAFDNTVRIWDAASRKEIRKLEGHTKLVLSVAISPDGKQILSGSQDNTAKIWDWPIVAPSKTLAGHPGAIQALAVKPDGKLAAAASGKSIKIWDLATGQAVKELGGHTGDVQATAWRGDGAGLATGDKANSIRVWKADLSPEATIEAPSEAVLALAYLPGKEQIVSAGSDAMGRLWQLPVERSPIDRCQVHCQSVRALT